MPHTTAQERALSLPEILTAILLHLPRHDLLLRTQLVCQNWHNTTNTSPTIRQYLFFLAIPANSLPEIELNPLLVAAFPPWFPSTAGPSDTSVWLPSTTPAEDAFRALPWSRNPDAYRYPTASWRRMHPAQPPRLSLHVTKLTERRHLMFNNSLATAFCEFEEGFRMGTLYDLVWEGCRRPGSEFGVSWDCGKESKRNWERGGKGGRKGAVDLLIRRVIKGAGNEDIIGSEFESLGREQVAMEWSEEIV